MFWKSLTILIVCQKALWLKVCFQLRYIASSITESFKYSFCETFKEITGG